jgi:hypothetical protein
MKMMESPMSVTDWTAIVPTNHPGETGFALWRTQNFGEIRIRIVEYSPGYVADHWCSKGHVILCLSGALDIELRDGQRFALRQGQTYHVGDGDPPHRTAAVAGDTGCGWCHLLDRTFQRNPATTELRDKLFITVHVDDSNECALKPYPKAFGVPFIYVLDEKGNLLGTEETKDWETGDGYDPRRIDAFLTKW